MTGFNLNRNQVEAILHNRPSGFLLHLSNLQFSHELKAIYLREFMRKHEKYVLSFKIYMKIIDNEKDCDDMFRKVFF